MLRNGFGSGDRSKKTSPEHRAIERHASGHEDTLSALPS
jgi:hypothetical protein